MRSCAKNTASRAFMASPSIGLGALHHQCDVRPIGRSDEPDGRCFRAMPAVLQSIKSVCREGLMRVLLIDDHALFREGVALLLRPLVEPLETWEAGSCEEAFALIETRGLPDLVLLDLGLPGMSGLEGLRAFRDQCPVLPVVALSSQDDRDTVLQALDAGAMGFIPKSSTSSILVGALRLVLAKGIYLPPSVFL